MGGFSNSVLGGAQKLIRAAIQSPNFVSGVSGWIVRKSGSAEFNSLTLRGQLIVQSSSQGIFVYKGAPAAGNLILAIAAATGTDPYGNSYVVGVTAPDTFFGTGNMVELVDAVLYWHNTQFHIDADISAETAGTNADTPALILSSPTNDALGNLGVALYLQGASQDGSNPGWLQITGQNFNTGALTRALVQIVGRIAATNPTATPGTKPSNRGLEVWHTPAYNAGWLDGPTSGTRQPLRYRIDAEDNFWLVGAMHTNSTTPNATAFTLPTGWFNTSKLQQDLCVENFGGAFTLHEVEIDTSGNVSIHPNLNASGHDLYLNSRFPLGNLT